MKTFLKDEIVQHMVSGSEANDQITTLGVSYINATPNIYSFKSLELETYERMNEQSHASTR